MRIVLRIVVILLLLLLISGIIFTSCMTFRTSDAKTVEYFKKRNMDVRINRVDLAGRELHYFETIRTADTMPLIVFVHGAPGAADNYYKYLSDSMLLTKAQLVAIDRPGYGYSGYGKSEPSIEKQHAAVCKIVEMFPKASKVILVGHSYGGPIVAKCAMMNPERFAGLMMLAPVNDPASEKVFWYANFARWTLTRWMLSKALQVSGDEKFAHIAELKKMENDWATIKIPIVHIHGMKDKDLAPPANIEFSKKHINPQMLKLVVLPEASHFIPWSDYDVVKKELLELLDR